MKSSLFFSVLLSFTLLNSSSFSQNLFKKNDARTGVESLVPAQQTYDTIGINNILEWVSAIGYDSFNPLADNCGFYWPKNFERHQTLIFTEGLEWGGFVNEDLRVGGVFYSRSSYLPLSVSEDDTTTQTIWKIRKDWQNLPEGDYKERCKNDYENWPVNLGAPWIDVNGDGIFTKGIDKPKFYGDEQLFMAYDNFDSSLSNSFYSTKPVRLEIHQLVYAFDSTNFLQDVIFKRFEIINKDSVTIKNFYATYWADDDLGETIDDYLGCDSNLYLGYQFNAFMDDYYYKPVAPAIGHAVLSGLVKDGKNLMMSAYGPNFKASWNSHDPSDSMQFYNVIRGLLNDGEPFRNPFSDEPSRYPLSGDPDAQIGWFEGSDWPPSTTFGDHAPYPSDRRYYICSGPIDFAPGDTQTVVIAEIVALGSSNVNSATKLREKAYKVQKFFGNDVILTKKEKNTDVPFSFKLFQNYPNPFSKSSSAPASTIIRYSIKNSGFVTLNVYDLLGRKVATLVKEERPAGNYSLKFNAQGLASGVYFYTLRAGDFISTKKMILLK